MSTRFEVNDGGTVAPEGRHELDLRGIAWACCNGDYGLCCAERTE